MKTRRFFSAVWKANAIVILIAGVLGVASLLVLIALLINDMTRVRHVDDVARVAVGGSLASKATMGEFQSVPGTAVLRAPLRVVQSYGLGSGGSKEASSVRNYLFYDSATRATRWLKPSMHSLIVRTWALPADDEHRDQRSDWLVSVYAMVAADTNADGVLNELDQMEIGTSNPDGTGYGVLVERADRVNEVRLLAADKVLVMYTVGDKLMGVEYSPSAVQSSTVHFEVKLPSATQ